MSDRFTVRYNPVVDNGNPQNGTSSVGAIDAGSMQILDATSRMVVEIQVRDIDQAQGNDAAAQIQAHLNDQWGYSVADSVYMMASGQQPTVESVSAEVVGDIAARITRGLGPQAIIGQGLEIDSSNPSIYRQFNAGSETTVVGRNDNLFIADPTYLVWSNDASSDGQAKIEFIDTHRGLVVELPVSQMSQDEARRVAEMITTDVNVASAFKSAVQAASGPNASASTLDHMREAAEQLMDVADRDGVKGSVDRPGFRHFAPGNWMN